MKGTDVVETIRRHARRLDGLQPSDELLAELASARIVLLGEATHGTFEFYRLRAELTRRLIEAHGFDAVAVEADWPAALRASRYAQGLGPDRSAADALGGFERFPRWMWRNAEIVRWLDWLRSHNGVEVDPDQRVGFFGLDLYSLRESMTAVVRYLDREDPAAAARARARYACFDDLADHPQAYGHVVSFGLRPDCERGVVQQLTEMCRDASNRFAPDQDVGLDERFYAQQNARVVRNAESYYRAMFSGRVESWNVRDRHMAETLALLADHLGARRGRPARIVVWAHNSHVGDARATDAADDGQLNLGQLVREVHGDQAFLLGFTTHTGRVTAADDWDQPARLKNVLPSRADSVERLLHDTGLERFFLSMRRAPRELLEALGEPGLERAIGVIYRPDTERWSHYFEARVARQFDGLVHIDTTEALTPLEGAGAYVNAEPAESETYPSGL